MYLYPCARLVRLLKHKIHYFAASSINFSIFRVSVDDFNPMA